MKYPRPFGKWSSLCKEVKCFKVNSCDKSNSWYKKLDEEYKSLGASAVGFVKLNEENELVGSFAKLLSDDEKTTLIEKFSLETNNILFIICGKKGENSQKFVET